MADSNTVNDRFKRLELLVVLDWEVLSEEIVVGRLRRGHPIADHYHSVRVIRFHEEGDERLHVDVVPDLAVVEVDGYHCGLDQGESCERKDMRMPVLAVPRNKWNIFAISQHHLVPPQLSPMLIMNVYLLQVKSILRSHLLLDLCLFLLDVSLLWFHYYSCKVWPTPYSMHASLLLRRGIFFQLFVLDRLLILIFFGVFSLLESHHDLWIRSLHALFRLNLFMLKYLSSSYSEDFSIYFVHECHGYVWHEVQYIDSCPRGLSIKISRIWPDICCWALDQNWALG